MIVWKWCGPLSKPVASQGNFELPSQSDIDLENPEMFLCYPLYNLLCLLFPIIVIVTGHMGLPQAFSLLLVEPLTLKEIVTGIEVGKFLKKSRCQNLCSLLCYLSSSFSAILFIPKSCVSVGLGLFSCARGVITMVCNSQLFERQIK